jgi:hypothetical protein
MADTKSKFKRPETPPAAVIGPDAENFVRGIPQSNETLRVEQSPQSEAAHQVEKDGPKKDNNKRLTIDIPESLHKRVKAQCATQGTTIADVVRAFLERKFPEVKDK